MQDTFAHKLYDSQSKVSTWTVMELEWGLSWEELIEYEVF